MVIAIASGKGGTGKTMLATGVALSIENSIYIDCDVEEPNGHIFLKPNVTNRMPVQKKVPKIVSHICNLCGNCTEVCEFNALLKLRDEILVFKELCHSCGVCTYFCPQKAIIEINEKIGAVEIGMSKLSNVRFVEGRLDIGQMSATPVINKTKEQIERNKINIIDAPPGTSCSMVETVRDSDYCILVTEPTPFGLNDLQLAVDALRILRTPFSVVINKADDNYTQVEKYCKKENVDVILKIPFNKNVAQAYSNGQSIIEVLPEYKDIFSNMINTISTKVEGIEIEQN